jgi:ribosome-associated translation inhibitor RaiA
MKIKNRLINLTKENIYHLYPRVTSIDINIKRLENKRYKCNITLKTKNESFFAGKEDQSYRKSLDKSYHAITKQLEKVKINKIHRSYPKVVFEENTPDAQAA